MRRVRSSCSGPCTRTGDEVTVALVGEVDISNEAALGAALAEVVEMKPARITIDLAGRVVPRLERGPVSPQRREAGRRGRVCDLVVRRPAGIVLRVLEICGVDDLLLGWLRRGRIGGSVAS